MGDTGEMLGVLLIKSFRMANVGLEAGTVFRYWMSSEEVDEGECLSEGFGDEVFLSIIEVPFPRWKVLNLCLSSVGVGRDSDLPGLRVAF